MRISDWSSDVCSSDLPRFTGTRFGVVLHDVLEHTDFARWAAWTPGAPAPTGDDAELIAERLRAGGYPAEAIDDGIDVLTPLIGHTLHVPLPGGVRPAAVPTSRQTGQVSCRQEVGRSGTSPGVARRLNKNHT